MTERHIVGLGGLGDTPEQTQLLDEHLRGIVGKERPNVMFIPTANADDDTMIVRFYERWNDHARIVLLKTFPYPPPRVRELILAQDAICVSGGNTANMIAIWRVHGIDTALREAWEQGILLFGGSAGMICWFEAGVTDSFGLQLEGMECLGFLPGSACPHYDGEELRRPRYRELIDGGFPEGIAADDGVGVHFVGTEISEIVTCRPGAAAYRVTRDGEQKLETRELQ